MTKPTKNSVFDDWTTEEIKTLGVVSEQMDYNPGDIIATEGEPAHYLCFVMSGVASIVRTLDNTNVQLASVSSGDCYGEVGISDVNPVVFVTSY